MAGTRQKKAVPTLTTSQRLANIVKSARDIMRKDRGLSGDLDRLPVLTWVMFLKFLDDSEQEKEEEAAMGEGSVFHPTLEAPYRWRDWAAEESGISGDALIAFINQEEVRRPDGQQGKGLFKYLRELDADNNDPRKKVVATVFKDLTNRMVNGYLLRDVANKINEIHFTSSPAWGGGEAPALPPRADEPAPSRPERPRRAEDEQPERPIGAVRRR